MHDIKNLEEFVKLYKVAVKQKWSREQFSLYTGLRTSTVSRKIRKIRERTGITIEHLALNDKPLTTEMITKFEDAFKKLDAKVSGIKGTSSVYIITAAQNATPVHAGFLQACLQFTKHRNAELIVVPYRYKNPTSLWNENNLSAEWWAGNLTPYLLSTKIKICENLTILADIKIQPTSGEPIGGLEAFSGRNSVIVGHPKIQLKSVPTLDGNPKLLLSTGAITVPNYTDSKVGHKGEFHHSLAAAVVEIDEDGTFHVRHVHASVKTGAFYDLDRLYTASGVTTGHAIEALITGDTHVEFIDEEVEDATYHNSDSIVAVLKPKKVILHDVLDFYSRNHHSRNSDTLNYGKHMFGRNNVQDELQGAADFIDRISRPGQENVIVKSNHDEAFDRWLREIDPKLDPENSVLFHYMKYHQYKSVRPTDTGFESFDPFKFWCLNPENGIGLENIEGTTFLRRDESLRVCGIEVGFHGDVGVNGSRGDVKSLSKLSDKIVIGHSHTPAIYESAYQVGLSAKKNLEYKRGPSTWMHTHCVIYPDGKRTLIHVINGKWNNGGS